MADRCGSSPPVKEDLQQVFPSFDFKTSEETLHWEACTKNPGHNTFIPVKNFTKDNLPIEYRNDDIVDCIRAMADLTVRITVTYVSQNRLKGDALYHARGKRFGHTGSGTVRRIKMSDRSLQKCPCRECEQSKVPQLLSASIFVQTACHVVFDQTEVENTFTDFFYDDEINIQNVRRLYGSKIIKESKEHDCCMFECVTHDRNLGEKLQERLKDFYKHNNDLKEKSMDSETQLAVIASHPHGCYKHITIGEWRMSDDVIVGAAPARQRSAPFDAAVVDCDKVIFTFPLGEDPCVFVRGQPEESEMTGIEVLVELPDGTSSKRSIWQMDRPAGETKKWLLREGGIHIPSETLVMVMELPNDEHQAFQDDKIINYYYEDLTLALRIYFREKTP